MKKKRKKVVKASVLFGYIGGVLLGLVTSCGEAERRALEEIDSNMAFYLEKVIVEGISDAKLVEEVKSQYQIGMVLGCFLITGPFIAFVSGVLAFITTNKKWMAKLKVWAEWFNQKMDKHFHFGPYPVMLEEKWTRGVREVVKEALEDLVELFNKARGYVAKSRQQQ